MSGLPNIFQIFYTRHHPKIPLENTHISMHAHLSTVPPPVVQRNRRDAWRKICYALAISMLCVLAVPTMFVKSAYAWAWFESMKYESRLIVLKAKPSLKYKELSERCDMRLYVARYSSDKQKRLNLWNDTFADYDIMYEMDSSEDSPIVLFLIALQTEPDDPMPVYRAAYAKRREQTKFRHFYTDPGDIDRHIIKLMPLLHSIVPDDLQAAYSKTLCRLLTDHLFVDRQNVNLYMDTMLRSVLLASPEELPTLYAIVEEASRKLLIGPSGDSYRGYKYTGHLSTFFLQYLKLFRTMPDSEKLLAAAREELADYGMDTYNRNSISTVKRRVAPRAKAPNAEQQQLLENASEAMEKIASLQYVKKIDQFRILALVLSLPVLDMYPENPRVLASTALLLAPWWNERLTESSYKTEEKPYNHANSLPPGAPNLVELAKKAEQLAPEDLLVLAAQHRLLFKTSMNSKEFVGYMERYFTARCKKADFSRWMDGFVPIPSWIDGLDDYHSIGDMDAADAEKLINTLHKSQNQCLSYALFFEFNCKNIWIRSADVATYDALADLLRKALDAPHIPEVDSMLKGNLGFQLYVKYNRVIRQRPRGVDDAALLMEALTLLEESANSWPQDENFPWNKALCEAFYSVLSDAQVELTPQLIERSKKALSRERRLENQVSRTNIEWALQFVRHSGMVTAPRDVQLRGIGLDMLEQEDITTLSAFELMDWVGCLENMADSAPASERPALYADILNKLNRVLALTPDSSSAKEIIEKINFFVLSTTPEEQWNDQIDRLYAECLKDTGLPPTGARSFMLFVDNLRHVINDKDALAAKGLVTLYEIMRTAAQGTEQDRRAVLAKYFHYIDAESGDLKPQGDKL